MDFTKIYDVSEFNDALIIDNLKKISEILKSRGYDPINQIVGYLMSGDPGYITSYNDARKMIMNIDRSKILEVLLKETIE